MMSEFQSLIDMHNQLKIILKSHKDLSLMTKAQLKSFASSLGINISSSLNKDAMIQRIEETDEYAISEKDRKNQETVELFKISYNVKS